MVFAEKREHKSIILIFIPFIEREPFGVVRVANAKRGAGKSIGLEGR
jgi:hypothetical protein